MAIHTQPRAEGAPARPERCAWLVLADGGPAGAIADDADPSDRLVVTDPGRFAAALVERRPRVVILSTPPAGPAEVELAVRERRRRPSLRIVHVSRIEDVDGRLAAIRAGVDEAVTDLIDPDELRGRIEILEARAHAPTRQELVVADDVVLDLVAHEVRRDGRLVHLRPKEFQLLAMLAAHPGRAYTRRQILDRVWGHDHVGDPRTVDVHVRWLRSKLEPDPDAPVHLVTVRGVGYRLDPQAR
jgi:DNA-binding response OmpR family regulator